MQITFTSLVRVIYIYLKAVTNSEYISSQVGVAKVVRAKHADLIGFG